MIEYILLVSVAFFGYKMFATPALRWIIAYWIFALVLIYMLFTR